VCRERNTQECACVGQSMCCFIHATAERAQPRIPEKEDSRMDEKPTMDGLTPCRSMCIFIGALHRRSLCIFICVYAQCQMFISMNDKGYITSKKVTKHKRRFKR
jgi:hypothetical protein